MAYLTCVRIAKVYSQAQTLLDTQIYLANILRIFSLYAMTLLISGSHPGPYQVDMGGNFIWNKLQPISVKVWNARSFTSDPVRTYIFVNYHLSSCTIELRMVGQ
jgi:hypothetical protein